MLLVHARVGSLVNFNHSGGKPKILNPQKTTLDDRRALSSASNCCFPAKGDYQLPTSR